MFRKCTKCRSNAKNPTAVSLWLVYNVPNVSEMVHCKPGQSRTLGALLKFTCQGWTSLSQFKFPSETNP